MWILKTSQNNLQYKQEYPVNKNWLLKSWGGAGLLLTLNSASALFGADAAAARQIINPLGPNDYTIRSLEENKQKQLQAAQTWQVFHDFQFSDQYEQSGIRFEHHPVDDGAKNYKA